VDETKEIVISYEALFELLRREKDREALQKLNDSFFEDVVNYIQDKKKSLSEKEGSSSLGERDKIDQQIRNIKRILKELYERRERKIINLAIDKSRIKAEVDTSILLKDEEVLFKSILSTLNVGREGILSNVLEGKVPENIEEKKEASGLVKEANKGEKRDTKLIRFLHAVPRFLGKELEEYGPFEEEDVASLPFEISNVLIEKGRAEEISEY
jgi:DNA replication factor GINS